MDSTDGFWRVYRDEWAVEYVSDSDGEDGRRECMQKFIDDYQGLVRAGQWRVVPWSEAKSGEWPWMLELRLMVMKGEWRDRRDASGHASKVDGTVVQEDSPEERELLHRGIEMTRECSG
jgi:hypothetical protein